MSGDGAGARSMLVRLIDAMNQRRLDQLDELLAPDFVRHCQATDMAINSREDYKTFLRNDAAAFPDNVQTVTHTVAEGDQVSMFATYEGTHRGPLGQIPPTGRKVSFDFAGVFRIEDDKLAELWITWDNMTILRQLGLLPEPTESGA